LAYCCGSGVAPERRKAARSPRRKSGSAKVRRYFVVYRLVYVIVVPVKLVSVRVVEFGDVEAAGALFEAQLREHDMMSTLEGLRRAIHAVISNPQFGFVLLASANGSPAGVAYAAAILSFEHEGIIGWLEELYVLPGQRDAGIGSMLLNEVAGRAQKLGWKGIELEVVTGHERAARLYLRHGFRPLSRSRFCRLFSRQCS
jgi:GNAT superfamily N-acetyltransferase